MTSNVCLSWTECMIRHKENHVIHRSCGPMMPDLWPLLVSHRFCHPSQPSGSRSTDMQKCGLIACVHYNCPPESRILKPPGVVQARLVITLLGGAGGVDAATTNILLAQGPSCTIVAFILQPLKKDLSRAPYRDIPHIIRTRDIHSQFPHYLLAYWTLLQNRSRDRYTYSLLPQLTCSLRGIR